MGNAFSTFLGGLLVYYMKAKNKLIGPNQSDQTDSLLPEEEKKEDIDTHIDIRKENIARNEYQLLKNNEEYEYLKDSKQENHFIEEISQEIKNVNIEFDPSEEEKESNKLEESMDDLKMQILSEQEDNEA
jgi:hypothetical protein